MNILETHSLKTDSRIGLAKMEGLLNSVLGETLSPANPLHHVLTAHHACCSGAAEPGQQDQTARAEGPSPIQHILAHTHSLLRSPTPGFVAWQGSKLTTPRAGSTEHLNVRLEQLEGRSLGANSLVTSLQQQLQQLQQQQQQASSTVKSVAEAAQVAHKALLAEAAAQKPPATDDGTKAELRARLESFENSARRTQTVASQQAADMKSRCVLEAPAPPCQRRSSPPTLASWG